MRPRMRLSRSTIILQVWIDAQIGRCNSNDIGCMHVMRVIKCCTGVVLEQVIAIRDELSRMVWAGVSTVPSHNAVSHHYIARKQIETASRDGPNTTSNLRSIIVNGTKSNISAGAVIVDATPLASYRIA